MLALPLQAFASAFMLGCTHEADLQPMAVADAAGCHESHPSGQAPASHDCEHCSACALGSALPIPMARELVLPAAGGGFAVPPADTFSGFIPDGPERPPRPVLA